MFLHLGADRVVPLNNVISITDMKFFKSQINQEFLKTMEEEHMIVDISEGNPKSFIVTDKIVYLSAISSLTLKKRAGQIFDDLDEMNDLEELEKEIEAEIAESDLSEMVNFSDEEKERQISHE